MTGGRRPNLVVVMTDDQGHWAMPHRMPELVMPHVAELLEEGLELTQAYCASPVCSPARASMLTGWTPSAHGVHDWLVGDRHPDAEPDHYLEGIPTTPVVLAGAGYQCAMTGKWHVGDAREPAPGFEYWYAHRYGGGPYYGAPIWVEGEPAEEPRYFTQAVTEQALDFLRTRDAGRPFYLQVNYTAPHTPWLDNHPDAYVDLYRDCDFPSVPREEPHPWVEPRHRDFADAFADPEPNLAGYCASLTAVDDGLGALRDELRAQGVEDDTILIYLSDNGFACGHHGIWGKGNGTYPMNFWDTSVRIPFVVRVPDGRRGVTETLVSAAGLHPTLCELAGVPLPADALGADSFAPLIRGEDYAGPRVVVVHSEYGGGRMITDGAWKLVVRHAGPDELYDLVADPGERTNLVDDPAHRGRRDELAAALADWFAHHERADRSAFTRDVRGYGQVHPVWRGHPDDRTYMWTDAPDGVLEVEVEPVATVEP
ncbi:MAG: sulfatase-like hydrolase/transferase [Propionibacteriaceae bacterium]|nr:sulfatase-like hydrolase/transferase [Propionibacteriaceae bacterium]